MPRRAASPSPPWRAAIVKGPETWRGLAIRARPGDASVVHGRLRRLAALGMEVDPALAHDLAALLTRPRAELVFDDATTGEQAAYVAMLNEIADAEPIARAPSLRLGDDLVTALVLRLLAFAELPGGVAVGEQRRRFVAGRTRVLVLLDALDVDTLRLFSMLGDRQTGDLVELVALLGLLGREETRAVADFSLELLPTVLETKRAHASSRRAAHGYAGITRKGEIDALLPSELAWDDEELARRLAEDELSYYAREDEPEQRRRHHHLLIDVSASMRGERSTFARGVAIALTKQLLLQGEEVTLRGFDAQLHEARSAERGRVPLAHLLGLEGERGRHPARVAAELLGELSARAGDGAENVVHFLTHTALYVPRALATELATRARLRAVFLAPRGGTLDLDWVDRLEAHWVVDHAVLEQRSERTLAAQRVLVASRRRTAHA